MKITADTNVLVRAAVMDDPVQGAVAVKALVHAEVVAVPLPSLWGRQGIVESVFHGN